MAVIYLKFKTLSVSQRTVGEGVQLFAFMRELMCQFHQLGRERSVETYQATLRSFSRYREGRDISFGDIDENVIIGYEAYLRSSGVTMNTSSFYMRILRATYNRAVERGLTTQCYPFRHVYTGVDKTVKRAITLSQIRQIKELDLSSRPALAFARDIFMFSFYTRGMSLVDIMYLTPSNLSNGRLVYSRRKTGQTLSVHWERCMQDIVDRYADSSCHYLIPLLADPSKDERVQYKNRSGWLSSKLRVIGTMIGLEAPLTMYVARHSWASIARYSHIPVSVISEGLGHDSEQTTQIYLSALDYTEIDKANRLILGML